MEEQFHRYPIDWYKNWFNKRYLTVYHHRDENEAREFIQNWSIWDRLFPGQWSLDLGCGSGRHSREFARRGLKVLAIDLSSSLLQATETSRNNTRNLWFVQADMRSIPSDGSFSLIASLFTSFGYFASDDEHQLLLNNLAVIIEPGGFLVLDLPNSPATMMRIKSKPVSTRIVDNMEIREERSYDSRTQRAIKRITITDDEDQNEYIESIRLYRRNEISKMLRDAGFTINIPAWGDYDGSVLSKNSPRMVFFIEKLNR